jgi:membrane protein
MAKLLSGTKRSMEFITDRLWKVRINKVNRRQGFLIKQLRVFSLAFKGFKDDNCLTDATALTFYSLFSIVPVLALLFAIAKGFDYEKKVQVWLLESNQQYESILKNAFVYADKLLTSANGGAIAGVGIILLLWSVMKLLINIEDSFNHIWEVKRGRSWVRKITDYLTIMLVGPLLLIISGGVNVAVQSEIESIEILGAAGTILIKGLAYLILTLLFTFLYVAIPNISVNFKKAFIAALVAAFLFESLSWAYVKFQIGANRMNAIYGGFAALPLFLIWVQYCWYIVLFGAELAYSFENVDHYELEEDIQNLSMRYKKAIALLIANLVAKRFYVGEKSLTASEISLQLDLPSRLTRIILNEFVETGVLVEVKTDLDLEIVYQPGITESKFTVKYLIDAIEKRGTNTLPISDNDELLQINKLMEKMENTMKSDLGHLHIKDLVTT